jgi:hypothetical protein
MSTTPASPAGALDAGARSLEGPSVMPYGDCRGMVEDRWGNVWQIATFKQDDRAPTVAFSTGNLRDKSGSPGCG